MTLGSASAIAASTRRYKVSDLKGSVLTRGPNQTRWLQAWDGQRLFEGQLIQVTEGAEVTLREIVSADGVAADAGAVQAERIQLRLTKPIIARITPDMLRSVSISTYFVEDKSGIVTDNVSLQSVKYNLADAWQRLTAVVTGRAPVVSKATLSELAKDGMALGSTARRLDLLAPVTNSVIESGEWPVDLKVVWHHPEKQRMRYVVYLWPAGSPRGDPVATTENDFFTVQIRQAGVYLTQVTSRDGGWQSPANVVHALIPAVSMAKEVTVISKAAKIASIQPTYPPANTALVGSGRAEHVDFAWNAAPSTVARGVILKVLDLKGYIVHQERTKQSQIRLTLVPGRYQWYVSTPDGMTKSQTSSLEILGKNGLAGHESGQSLWKRLVDEKKDTTLVLSEGL